MPQQDVQRATAAVDRKRGAEGKDVIRALQPMIDDGLQHGSARSGAPTFAVNHAHTVHVASDRVGNEFA